MAHVSSFLCVPKTVYSLPDRNDVFYQVWDCPLAAPHCVLSFLSSKNAYFEPEFVIMYQAPSQSLSREMMPCDWSTAGPPPPDQSPVRLWRQGHQICESSSHSVDLLKLLPRDGVRLGGFQKSSATLQQNTLQ